VCKSWSNVSVAELDNLHRLCVSKIYPHVEQYIFQWCWRQSLTKLEPQCFFGSRGTTSPSAGQKNGRGFSWGTKLLLRHVADTPLKGFFWGMWLICRCWYVAHARWCSTGGGVGGAVNVPDDIKTGSTELVVVEEMLHMLAYAQQGVGVGRADNVLDGFKAGRTELDWFCWNSFTQSTVSLMLRDVRKRKGWASDGLHLKHENHEFLMFFCTRRAKLTHCEGETQIFELESHAYQSKWMSMLQTFLNKPHKYQLFVS